MSNSSQSPSWDYYFTRDRTYKKYLLNDLSNTAKHADIVSEFIRRDQVSRPNMMIDSSVEVRAFGVSKGAAIDRILGEIVHDKGMKDQSLNFYALCALYAVTVCRSCTVSWCWCYLVNPWNAKEFAASICFVLDMPADERERRHLINFKHMTTHTSQEWVQLL